MFDNNEITFKPSLDFLLKSISEQGYTLETALADLIDNSITANSNRIEIITLSQNGNFSIFIADNGNGMSENTLIESLNFPSKNMDLRRDKNDLGRFGLGLKTASFSQSRKFTTISRARSNPLQDYNGFTWDIDRLGVDTGFKIFKKTNAEIVKIINLFKLNREEYLENCSIFETEFNTLIYWETMRKFSLEDSFYHQLEIVKEYLGIVFHDFIENHNLTIRFNGEIIQSFNPFILYGDSLLMDEVQFIKGDNSFKMRGYVVCPNYEKNINKWVTKYKSLFDLEGLFIYRNKRLIFYGGWNGLKKRSDKLKLARLRIDFDNNNDLFFQLNVDKSKVIIPLSAKKSILEYVEKLENLAMRQIYNREVKNIKTSKKTNSQSDLIIFKHNNKGKYIEFNSDFFLFKQLLTCLNAEHHSTFKALMRITKVRVNKIIQTHEDSEFVSVPESKTELSKNEFLSIIQSFKDIGWNENDIEKLIIDNLGYTLNNELKELVKN